MHFFQISVENEENIKQLKKKAIEFAASPNPSTKALFDQRGANFFSQMPFRQKYIELTTIAKSIKKVALLTDNRLLWVFLSFNFNAGKNMKEAAINVKPFFSEKEAMAWLKRD